MFGSIGGLVLISWCVYDIGLFWSVLSYIGGWIMLGCIGLCWVVLGYIGGQIIIYRGSD